MACYENLPSTVDTQLKPLKDRRAAAAGKEGQQSSTAAPRLYAPRRQAEYEPRADVASVPLSPVSENIPETRKNSGFVRFNTASLATFSF